MTVLSQPYNTMSLYIIAHMTYTNYLEVKLSINFLYGIRLLIISTLTHFKTAQNALKTPIIILLYKEEKPYITVQYLIGEQD